MGHSLGRCQSFLWLGYELLDQVFGILGDNLPLLAFKGVVALLDFCEDLIVVVSVEGGVAAEEGIQNAPQCPHITLLIVITSQNFW